MSDADKRTLKVKTGVVKRLRKELEMYASEVEAESAKVQRLRDQGADSHDIKYAVSNPSTPDTTCGSCRAPRVVTPLACAWCAHC